MKKEIIIAKIKSGEMKYKDVSIFKKNDLDIIKAYISVASNEELTTLAKKHKNDFDVMHEIVTKDAKLYKHIGKDLKASYNLGLMAVRLYGPNYAYLSKALQEESVFVYEAVKENNDCINLIDDKLLSSYSIGLDLLNINADLWNHLGENLKNSQEFAAEGVKNNPWLLEKLSPEFKDDFAIVYEGIVKNGRVLQFASERLKNLELSVGIAVRNDGAALEYVSHRLRASKEIVLDAIDSCPLALRFANVALQDDEEVVLAAVELEGAAAEFMSKRLLHDDKFIKECIKLNPLAEFHIKEAKRIEARSYKLKSIKSDEVQVRNGVVFGAKLSQEKNELYNSIMQKSFTKFLDKLSHDELLVLDRLIKADANIIVEKIKKEGRKELSDSEIRTIATYRKIYLRVKQFKLDEEDYDRSKVDMVKCYKLVDDAYKLADKVLVKKMA